MNKEQIMAEAKLAEERIAMYDIDFDDDMGRALITAATLLQKQQDIIRSLEAKVEEQTALLREVKEGLEEVDTDAFNAAIAAIEKWEDDLLTDWDSKLPNGANEEYKMFLRVYLQQLLTKINEVL